jgi:alkylhydroperoxidase family enzyme
MFKTQMIVNALSILMAMAGQVSMAGTYSRLPDLPDPPVDPILIKEQQERKASGGSVINLQLTTGHAPKIMIASGGLAKALRVDAITPRYLRELAIIRTAGVVGSDYELNQHYALAQACRYPEDKIKAIQQWQRSGLFDEKERAVLSYVEEMTHGGDVSDPTFDQLSQFFSTQEVVEITMTVSQYYGNGLVTKALRIKPETDGRLTYPGKC